jgi:hypothetical protein
VCRLKFANDFNLEGVELLDPESSIQPVRAGPLHRGLGRHVCRDTTRRRKGNASCRGHGTIAAPRTRAVTAITPHSVM